MNRRDHSINLDPAKLRRMLGINLAVLVILIVSYGFAYETESSPKVALERISQAYTVLDRFTSRQGEAQDLVFSGIRGMLRTLDPHTHFLESETYRFMKQQQEGSFFGIGIQFDIRDGILMVVSPIAGTPAARADIRVGDRIVRIENKSTVGITTTEVINTLRGEKGSTVRISIKRNGVEELLDFDLTRDEIPLHSLRYAFMLDDTTAYVFITDFTSTTYRELREKLNQLGEQGMARLILDLRYNSGGLLTAAHQLAGLFLRPGQLIVTTDGRMKGARMELKAEISNSEVGIPLVVLVNEGSASASEIVAGAIQDHDRGLIVGQPTFGKGLVGSLYPLNLECALQITTAQYFTASGRFIQKPYEIPHRIEGVVDRKVGDSEQDPFMESSPSADVYYTDGGRKVYGGGGITPDIIVEEREYTDIEFRLEPHYFPFAVALVGRDPDRDPFRVPEKSEVEEFQAYVLDQVPDLDPVAFAENKEHITARLHREILTVRGHEDEAQRARLLASLQIQKAFEVLDDYDRWMKPES